MSENYCFVENGRIVEGPKKLPKVWRNVSGLDKDPENARALGWFPCTIMEPDFDPATRKRGERRDAISADGVTISWEVVELSAEELAQRARDAALGEIRRLEALETPRRIAEALLDLRQGGNGSGKAWLVQNRAKIAAERKKI